MDVKEAKQIFHTLVLLICFLFLRLVVEKNAHNKLGLMPLLDFCCNEKIMTIC